MISTRTLARRLPVTSSRWCARRGFVSATHSQQQTQKSSSLMERERAKTGGQLTTMQKVASAAKTTTNLGVIALGVGLVGIISYALFAEAFGKSSTRVFGEALDRIRAHPECQKMIGLPMVGHGEPSGSRIQYNRRIAYQKREDDKGRKHLLMRFYVKGPRDEGTVRLDLIKDSKGKWRYKYLFVDIPGQGLPSKRIFVEYAKDL